MVARKSNRIFEYLSLPLKKVSVLKISKIKPPATPARKTTRKTRG